MGFPEEQAAEYARAWDEDAEDVPRVGDVEATPGPGLSERWAKVVKVVKPTPGRVEATMARRPKQPAALKLDG